MSKKLGGYSVNPDLAAELTEIYENRVRLDAAFARMEAIIERIGKVATEIAKERRSMRH